MKNLPKGITYIGADDKEAELFEGQYSVPNGMSYNSYLIDCGNALVVADTVEASKTEEWLENLTRAAAGRTPDYLIVSHIEPDHSAGIFDFLDRYPSATVLGSAKAFAFIKQFYGREPAAKTVVGDGDVLKAGNRVLRFFTAPMVHWPEVTVCFDETSGTLFSADAFGKFGALDCDEEWTCEARRYYFNIVGKYGAQVQSLLKKLPTGDIRLIAPLHGPALDGDLNFYLDKYAVWSSYAPEDRRVHIAAASIYGHTTAAANRLAQLLKSRGEEAVVSDLNSCDTAEAVEDAFRCDVTVFAAPTYDGGVFPSMADFISRLKQKGFQNRGAAFIENGTWAPLSAKVMRAGLEEMKNITFIDPVVTLRSAPDAASEEALLRLADALCARA